MSFNLLLILLGQNVTLSMMKAFAENYLSLDKRIEVFHTIIEAIPSSCTYFELFYTCS